MNTLFSLMFRPMLCQLLGFVGLAMFGHLLHFFKIILNECSLLSKIKTITCWGQGCFFAFTLIAFLFLGGEGGRGRVWSLLGVQCHELNFVPVPYSQPPFLIRATEAYL